MSITVQSRQGCSLLNKVLIAGLYNGVEIKQEIVERGEKGYELGHPLKKCPVLRVDSHVIFESNAMARFVARSNGDSAKLCGTNDFEMGLIDSWVDLASNDVDVPLQLWLDTVQGKIPNNPDATKKAIADVRKVLVTLDAYLANKTFLVRDRLSLADIVLATSLLPGYRSLLDPGFRKAFKNTNRWFLTCVNQPFFVSVIGKAGLCEKKAVAPAPEKKEQPKKEQPKEQAKKAEEAPAPAAPKKAKPFSNLPPSPFNMNDFKVCYSNEDTRSVALPHLYEHFDKEGWSLYFVEYKYPEDLQKLFMVSNLLGGFCQRVEGIRDHVCGSFLIFGEENDYEIHGTVLLRSAEWPADVMGDIPDTDSYNFKKIDLDTITPEDKAFFEDLWAWEGEFKGKKFTDSGKVMK